MGTHKERNESPICCILFCEFHPVQGPKITYQIPYDYVTKEKFDALSVYLIPKNELQGRLITVNSCDLKIIGYPVDINGQQYPRNRLIFNLCFVCVSSMRTVQYEPVVKKLASYLINLEKECAFIFNKETKSLLPSLMTDIRDQLNSKRECTLPITESTTIYLKVARVQPIPDSLEDHDVPIFLTNEDSIVQSEWDLTTQQVLPFIDGYRHVAKIALEAEVEVSLVKACLQNMIYYGLITLIPIFQYSNVYITTSQIVNLIESPSLQKECLKFVSKSNFLPSFRSVFQFYCSMSPGVTIKDLCIRYNPSANGIDERKLVRFGSTKGLIRRLQKYPVFVEPGLTSVSNRRGFYKYFDGNHSYDMICNETGKSYQELEKKVEKHPSVVVCWK